MTTEEHRAHLERAALADQVAQESHMVATEIAKGMDTKEWDEYGSRRITNELIEGVLFALIGIGSAIRALQQTVEAK